MGFGTNWGTERMRCFLLCCGYDNVVCGGLPNALNGPLPMLFCWSSSSCGCALVSVIVSQAAAADDEASVRVQILALEKAWNQAYKAGDIKALSAISTTRWCWWKTMVR